MDAPKQLNTAGSQERTDLVAFWNVPLLDDVHAVEFEHGGTTGKRVIRVDGKEILRRDWMFKLVGDEKFALGKQGAKCELRVDPMPHFAFAYSLFVDGKSLEKFTEKQSQTTKSWVVLVHGKRFRVVFEKQTLNVWVNGHDIETDNSFIDAGSQMTFEFEELKGAITATISADRKQGIIYKFYVDEVLIEEDIMYG